MRTLGSTSSCWTLHPTPTALTASLAPHFPTSSLSRGGAWPGLLPLYLTPGFSRERVWRDILSSLLERERGKVNKIIQIGNDGNGM